MKTKGSDSYHDHLELDEVLSETHCYTYFHPDNVVGSSNDGFLTPRMKNTAFCPSSAIEKLEDNSKFEF
jgi:hypothetical protein